MANNIIEEIFNNFQVEHEKEQETRNVLWVIAKELDSHSRKMLTLLQIIHSSADKKIVSENVEKADEIVQSVQRCYRKLEEILLPISPSPFNQFHDIWRHATQKLTFLASLLVFLKKGELANFEEVAVFLGMRKQSEKGIQLELDDYLYGLLTLASELSRLAVNSVILGDYQRPLEISRFVGELAAGFRLLTFKNDFLRKRYDALKYDVKKIEEVVYDLSIRGLSTPQAAADDS